MNKLITTNKGPKNDVIIFSLRFITWQNNNSML